MKTTLKLSFLLLSGVVSAQNEGVIRCGSDNYYQKHLQEHPEVYVERQEYEKFTKNFVEKYNPLTRAASITIPVVFHVNDPSNPQKVTLAQVQSAIGILNEDYRAINADIVDIRPEFTSIIADMDINFCLASKDPQGNPTTGITYHYNSYNGREPDGYGSSVKGVEYWPGDKYLNIWIVNETEYDGSLYNSGWAFLPDSWVASNNVDGIVYNHRYLGYTGSSEVSGTNSWQAEMARVLTHEVGHYLNLHHTFENYCSAPGDNVADTPPVYYHGSNNCDQLGTFCSGVTFVQDQNYMDYTPCPSMFTNGQKARVHAALNSSVAGRSNLWTEANLIATGCHMTSVEEEGLSTEIELYPNPVGNSFQLTLGELSGDEVEITVYDSFGKLVFFHQYAVGNTGYLAISSTELEAGMYFLNVYTDGRQASVKFVKE